MTTEQRTCLEAVAGLRRLRAVARGAGMPPTADADPQRQLSPEELALVAEAWARVIAKPAYACLAGESPPITEWVVECFSRAESEKTLEQDLRAEAMRMKFKRSMGGTR